MSYTSKFTERFDIDISPSSLQELSPSFQSAKTSSLSSRLSTTYDPVYCNPVDFKSNTNTNTDNLSTITASKPIDIPQKNNARSNRGSRQFYRDTIASFSSLHSHGNGSEKHHDALATRFRSFMSSILNKKREKQSSTLTSNLSRAISTKI
ncbi:hypothetical protein BDF20DRAFT_651179 [Mycotypha africana]|uniref:uncharacterized protein n=1 Tax=Mycotypha africana TaxID=64632 RepID=UPI0023003218|nr:uncharacterized protein BDF20DRAFT_651179 [Mycotypha africana]KAI8973426.1 hypothetical protein BDF20DRAFT_651179 [Mycotypha africana]